jgi:hypothetical protein
MKQALAYHPGVRLSPEKWISDLEFANDIFVLREVPAALQLILDHIESFGKMIRLEMNAMKTKIFLLCPDWTFYQELLSREHLSNISTWRYFPLVK